MIPKTILHFEIAGVLISVYGLSLAFLVDITGWSAVIVTLCSIPFTHVIKFLLYRKVFHNNIKEKGK